MSNKKLEPAKAAPKAVKPVAAKAAAAAKPEVKSKLAAPPKMAAAKPPKAPAKPIVKVAAAGRPEPAPKAPAKVAAKGKLAATPAPKPAAAPKAQAAAPKAQAAPPKAQAAPPKAQAAPAQKKPDGKKSGSAKSAAKANPQPAAPPKAAQPPKAEAKVLKAAKAEKPAKPAKEAAKLAKPPKLAPVEAAFAKPRPPKPLAVAAGRAQPISRTLATPPVRTAPRPLAAPKAVPAAEAEQVGEQRVVPSFKSKANGTKDLVLVGAIAGAFGVKGEIRLRAFTEKREGVISYGPLFGEDGKIMLKPKSWRELKDGVAVVAPEVKTREDADKMRGARLYVPRVNLPATAQDEFYIVDLLGCRAEAIDGKVLGDICAVWNFGAGDIIEYRPPNGGPNVRITFTKETTPLVDLVGKRVVLDPPAPEAMEK